MVLVAFPASWRPQANNSSCPGHLHFKIFKFGFQGAGKEPLLKMSLKTNLAGRTLCPLDAISSHNNHVI